MPGHAKDSLLITRVLGQGDDPAMPFKKPALSKDQIDKIVQEIITETKAASIKDMGTVMKAVMAKTKGAADNKTVSEVIKAKFQ